MNRSKFRKFMNAFGDSVNQGFLKFHNIGWYIVLAIYALSLIAFLALVYREDLAIGTLGKDSLSNAWKGTLIENNTWGFVFLLVFGFASCAIFGKIFVDLTIGIVVGFRALKGDTPTTESNTNPLTIDDTNKETSFSSESVETPPYSEQDKDFSVSPPTFASRQPLEPNKKLSVSISSSFKDCFLGSFTEIDKKEPNKKTMYNMLTNKLCSREWLQVDLERVGLILYYTDVISFEKLGDKTYKTWITTFYNAIGQNNLSIIGESKINKLYKSKEVLFDETFVFLYEKYLEKYPDGKGPIRFIIPKSTKQTPPKTQ